MMIKSLTKEILKNRLFLALLLVMTFLSSFMFFFIRFSIDANMAYLDSLASLTDNQRNYYNALTSNTSLSFTFLFSVPAVAALAYAMFFFRFFTGAKKQIGVYKALGYKNINLQAYFVAFTVLFSLVGLLAGMLAGYFGSSVHLNANAVSYGVGGLQKGISASGVLMGIGIPLAMFAVTAFLCCCKFYFTENGALIYDRKLNPKGSKLLRIADKCVAKLPVKNKAPLRIALGRPLSVSLITVASTVFTVMLVLGFSLTQSSETVYKTQSTGHNYLYESVFSSTQTAELPRGGLRYLSFGGTLAFENYQIEQTVFGMDFDPAVYDLRGVGGEALDLPGDGSCYLSLGTAETYGIAKGERITFALEAAELTLTVRDIAYNAKSKTVIVSRTYLAGVTELDTDSYNGVLSMTDVCADADKVTDNEARADMLARDKVSGATSAVLNHATGIAAGVILIFLALFITFQDSLKDMLIMENLGYRAKEIKRLLINVFFPVLIIAFCLTAFPAVMIARAVQRSLALSIGDYLPFSTNILVVLAALVGIVAIYALVQWIFTLGVKRTIKKKGILEYTNSL